MLSIAPRGCIRAHAQWVSLINATLHKTSSSAAVRAGKTNGASSQRPKGDVQDRVYDALRHWLMVGHFLPGEPISLRNLAGELGVSPMPVRAALRHLIAEGGIEMLPNRTMRVPHMTREELLELLSLQRELAWRPRRPAVT